jgi:pilus assembly protein Flp/PilA
LDLIIRCLQNRSGATVIEYVFIASIVSIAAIAGMQLIGNELSSIFTTVANDL